jgi:hypothetical protein
MTNPPIQFDRAASKDGAPKGPGVTCSMCNKSVGDKYYTLGDLPVCTSCKISVERDASKAKRPAIFIKSSVYGLGASIAGAILYYGFYKMFSSQWALVAIACGYMVGYAMRKGANGWGGRRFQLAAAGLTYLSVGMAYIPIALEGAKDRASANAASDSTSVDVDSTGVATADSAALADSAVAVLAGDPITADSATAAVDSTIVSDSTVAADSAVAAPVDSGAAKASGDDGPSSILIAAIGLVGVFAFALALPILSIIGSLPFGLITALIIFFGIQQAWKMTAAQDLEFHGPLTVAK